MPPSSIDYVSPKGPLLILAHSRLASSSTSSVLQEAVGIEFESGRLGHSFEASPVCMLMLFCSAPTAVLTRPDMHLLGGAIALSPGSASHSDNV